MKEGLPIAEVKKEVERIVREELRGTPYRAFFFGSRVTGTAGERSDLDVGLEDPAGKSLPASVLATIRARCEALPTLFSVDIVDFASVGAEFRALALAATESI